MTSSADEAVARARAALGEDAGIATAWPVARLDGLPGYWLVTLDDDSRGTLGVAAIGEDGALVGSGRPAPAGDCARHLRIDAARARALSGAAADALARLVWFPSRASQSPLYPLWEVVRSAGAAVWVTLDGTVLAERPDEGRGG